MQRANVIFSITSQEELAVTRDDARALIARILIALATAADAPPPEVPLPLPTTTGWNLGRWRGNDDPTKHLFFVDEDGFGNLVVLDDDDPHPLDDVEWFGAINDMVLELEALRAAFADPSVTRRDLVESEIAAEMLVWSSSAVLSEREKWACQTMAQWVLRSEYTRTGETEEQREKRIPSFPKDTVRKQVRQRYAQIRAEERVRFRDFLVGVLQKRLDQVTSKVSGRLAYQIAIADIETLDCVRTDPVPDVVTAPFGADTMRHLGWKVASHFESDDAQNTRRVFWCFTRGHDCITGEGLTDHDAFMQIAAKLQQRPALDSMPLLDRVCRAAASGQRAPEEDFADIFHREARRQGMASRMTVEDVRRSFLELGILKPDDLASRAVTSLVEAGILQVPTPDAES